MTNDSKEEWQATTHHRLLLGQLVLVTLAQRVWKLLRGETLMSEDDFLDDEEWPNRSFVDYIALELQEGLARGMILVAATEGLFTTMTIGTTTIEDDDSNDRSSLLEGFSRKETARTFLYGYCIVLALFFSPRHDICTKFARNCVFVWIPAVLLSQRTLRQMMRREARLKATDCETDCDEAGHRLWDCSYQSSCTSVCTYRLWCLFVLLTGPLTALLQLCYQQRVPASVYHSHETIPDTAIGECLLALLGAYAFLFGGSPSNFDEHEEILLQINHLPRGQFVNLDHDDEVI